MACLLDFAFRKLIGVKGACPGMRTIKNTALPSLIDIAPAVWDLQYLQTMSAHAQVIPSIAAGIARLANARSASLREKLDMLTRQITLGSGSQELDGADAGATDEVKKRLWLLCQTRIRPEPIKRLFVTRQADENTANQPPSPLGLPGREPDIPPVYVDDFDFDSGALVAMENYGLVADHDQYAVFPETLPGPDYPELGALGQAGESYMAEGGEPASDEWTHSSEGDYFYTDGQGNVYPIEREAVSEDDQINWPSTPQLVGSDGFSQQPDEETEEYWIGGANQTYIMYHEDWSPDPGVYIRADDAADQQFLRPHPDDAPLDDWAGD
ncbi:hypothetical protein C8A01DRAFT_47716 [Parachaetomium inaequale]|uniref:Uncharacterized protein n=1 Tax=Parachaetomium inaequale TaxID=2588326 RepID=A0AAN6SQB9_9PEZI|nr:hypothetical protein C8A01DRAFT_47716 [Parachaetomium inaequale]